MCFHVCVYMCMGVYLYVCVCVSLCVCLCVCVCVLSKCSGQCGEGRMTRYVVCQTASGSSISEDQCDHALRPLAVQPCGDRNCPAHWVEQEWEQVSGNHGDDVCIQCVYFVNLAVVFIQSNIQIVHRVFMYKP